MTTDNRSKGLEIIEPMWGQVKPGVGSKAAFTELTIDYLFGQIWSRSGLGLRDRSLVTVATLAALGRLPELRYHLVGALANGVTEKELEELLIHIAHYAGWPAGNAGLSILVEVLSEHAKE